MNWKVLTVILLSVLKFGFAEQQKYICGFETLREIYGSGYIKYDPREAENCQDCLDGLCKQADLLTASSKTDNLCYWNEYRDICLSNRGELIS